MTALGYTIEAEKSKSPAKQSSHDHSSHEHSSHDDDGDEDDGHNHGGGGFNLKREGLLVGVVIVLFVLGSVFEKQLNATPLSIGSYLVPKCRLQTDQKLEQKRSS